MDGVRLARIRMIEHVWKTGDPWMAGGAVVLLLAVGCGDGSPTAPTSTRATVTASCNPCEVFVGGESILRTDASDPDGDRLTYRWTATAGVFWLGEIGPTTSWRAPNQPGSVSISVTVTDGRGGSASDTVTIQVSALPTRPVDPRFDDRFWRQFVFNQFDDPGTIGRQASWMLETTSPNIYIKTTDPNGHRVLFGNGLAQMIEWTPHYWNQLTGQSFRGRIETGRSDPGERRGWIRVIPDWMEDGVCGRAAVGQNPGRIRLNAASAVCLDLEVFAHELGHALGFRHVDPQRFPQAVMKTRGWRANQGQYRFSAREVYHARLAYEVGRGQRYCGWPFSPTCFSRTALGALHSTGPPIIIID